MKVKIDAKKKQIVLTALGNEKKVLTLIAAFSGDAVMNVNSNILKKLASTMVSKIVIDMTHENISKEFIQLVLRLK